MSVPEDHHQVSSARAYRYLKPWYSPSNSYLDISSIRETVKCGGDIPVQVTYTTPPDTDYNFHYQVGLYHQKAFNAPQTPQYMYCKHK